MTDYLYCHHILTDYLYCHHTQNECHTCYGSTTSTYGHCSTKSAYDHWNYFYTASTTSIYDRKYYIDSPYDNSVYKPTDEELLRCQEEMTKAAKAAKKAKEYAEEAARNARLLLTDYLDNDNTKRLLNNESLVIPSRLFDDIKYHIPISNGRIKAWKEDKIITELCLSVKESRNLPLDDVILTKLLHIINDEENFLRTANHFNMQENLMSRMTQYRI